MNTLFHAAFCSAHLFWSVSNLADFDFFRDIVGLSDFRTFGLSDLRTCGYAFQSSLGMCFSFRIVLASPAIYGGKPPLTPPLHTQYSPIAKRYNWIFWFFSGHPGSKMDSKSLKSHPKWSWIPCSMQHFAARIFLVKKRFGQFWLFSWHSHNFGLMFELFGRFGQLNALAGLPNEPRNVPCATGHLTGPLGSATAQQRPKFLNRRIFGLSDLRGHFEITAKAKISI